MNDFVISGAGRGTGGEYDAVKISGSGKLTDDIVCASLSISGSGKVEGNVECRGDVRVSGAGRIEGWLTAGTIRISGACHVHGNIKAERIRISGSMHAEGEMAAEEIEISGGIHCEELMSAEKIDIRLEDSGAKIQSIGGTVIHIEKRKRRGRLQSERIEGDNIYLEGVRCDKVCGKDVVIGPDCKISTVEYTGTIQISDKSEVEEICK